MACNWNWISHILTFCAAGVMIATGVIKLIQFNDFVDFMIGIYFFAFAAIMISSLFSWAWYERWCGFAAYRFGRGMFIVLCGVLAYNSTTWMWVMMFVLFGIGGVLVFASCVSGDAIKELKGKEETSS